MASSHSIPRRLSQPSRKAGELAPDRARRLAELSPLLLAAFDSRLRLTWTSPALERTLGAAPGDLDGRNWLELIAAEDLAGAGRALERAREAPGAEVALEARTLTRAGELRSLAWRVVYEAGGFLAAAADLTAQRRAEGALASGDQRLEALIQQVPAMVYTAALGADGRWSFVSAQVERMLGWTPAEWTAEPELWIDRIHPDDRERVLADEEQLRGAGDQLCSEYRMLARDGRVLWVRDAATVIAGEDGRLLLQGLMLDISDLKRAQGAVVESEQKYRTLVETSKDMIWATDVENRFTFVNDAVRRTHGYEPHEMIGRPFTDFQDPATARRDRRVAAGVRDGAAVKDYETEHLRKDGSSVTLSFNADLLRDAEGNVIGAAGTARDVTEQRRVEQAVASKHQQLQSIIDNSPLVIYAKDDEHRYLLANRELEVQLGLPPGGALGRRDAELLGAAEAELRRLADQRVIDSGSALEAEETLGAGGRERTYVLHRFPLRSADGSVYGVCGIGTDVTERREREDELRARLEWSLRIRRAIDEDRLVLHAQPIVDARSGEPVQRELLVRMLGDDGGLVMPGEFLPQAERFHLAPLIDRWVIAEAARLAGTGRVEVNLSGQSVGDASLPDYVEARLRESGADPSNVVFEITETAAARDIGQATRLAKRLSELGCGFALDDFGTGYGSFTYLRHLPVGYIKIDVDFVRGLSPGSPDVQVVSAIIDVARKFGIQTVAEGVESEEALRLLRELGADFVQGYHLGRPGPLAHA
jgi:PAS domain S-box-containing protein